MEYAIFIFDGVCNFCNGFVNFIIDHDPKKRIKFLASQSKNAKKILKKYKISHNKIVDSLILIEGEKYTTRSTAFFHIVKYLTFPYFLLHAGIIVPKFFRDYIYECIGKNRYKLFGKRKVCRTPTKELKERFL
ncbi:MAG: hypothetical protein QT08_C0013G0031 [archaeon GW2011_AR17]|nr:MAG: hypothetical protein QT08_C0013G0031 [archaeon GW2011_AR17]MBS3153872.1 DUF393 domain-containing protein [Candidatus Woesearchaeota archaeon]HIH15473.1 DUF393 domain-containing protein [Nanoarchaeota archaeon]HIH59276.1 DUF393 domain-containing protein [Nanoarchaeota archaeon]HII13929.1 DUF393 domain-containing protein [Nanoarchaeota archaeon]